jgi:hypothetical protein
MKGFTSLLFSLLLVVVGGWGVVGMQEGQKAYQQHLRAGADLRVISAERDHFAALATGFEAKLAQSNEQFLGAQRIIADMGEQLTWHKAQAGKLLADVEGKAVELDCVRLDKKTLQDELRTISDVVERLQAERAIAAK